MTVANLAAIAPALEQDYAAAIATALSLPTQYQNAPFEKPQPTAGSIWARFTILNGDREQIEIAPVGSRTHRFIGVLHVLIFVPLDSGEAAASAKAAAIAERYCSIERAGCKFVGSTIDTGLRDGPWWAVPVRCPFHADMLK